MEQLIAQKRDTLKKTAPLRKNGLIPAEMYGGGMENMHVTVPAADFRKVFKHAGESAVVKVVVDKTPYSVLIHDVQRHFLTSEIVHVDFYRIQAGQVITTRVPFEFVGQSLAVKDGGVLGKVMADVEVEAPVEKLPRTIVVDLTGLAQIGDSIHLKDLAIAQGVELHADKMSVVVTVTAPRKEEEVTPAAVVDVSTIKVEGEEKKAERAAKKEEEKA